MSEPVKVTLSYTVCTCYPWLWRFNEVGEFTLREKKTAEEIQAEKERLKKQGKDTKPKPFKFTHLSTFEIDEGNTCHFLIGMWPSLKAEFDKAGVSYELDDKRDPALIPRPDYSALQGVELREGQDVAIATIAVSDGGLICSNVGFGKSFIITQLCKLYPSLNILVVCASGEVVRELYKAISTALPGQAGILDMQHKDVAGKRIIVTTTKSMAKIKPEQVQLLLFDEAHNVGYNATGFLLQEFCFCRRFGFTATPIRNNGDYKYLESLFGPVLQQVTFKDAEEAGNVTPIRYCMAPIGRRLDYLANLTELPDAIKHRLYYTNNPVRNRVIVQIFKAIREVAPDVQILIMVNAIEHLIRLCEMIPECRFAHGERGDLGKYRKKKGLEDVDMFKYRQSAVQAAFVKKSAELGEYKSIVATGVYKQGINLSHLAVLIRADGATSGIPSVQIPGRLARLDDDKPAAYLIDLGDDFCEAAEERANKRLQHYRKEGWTETTLTEILEHLRKEHKV